MGSPSGAGKGVVSQSCCGAGPAVKDNMEHHDRRSCLGREQLGLRLQLRKCLCSGGPGPGSAVPWRWGDGTRFDRTGKARSLAEGSSVGGGRQGLDGDGMQQHGSHVRCPGTSREGTVAPDRRGAAKPKVCWHTPRLEETGVPLGAGGVTAH